MYQNGQPTDITIGNSDGCQLSQTGLDTTHHTNVAAYNQEK